MKEKLVKRLEDMNKLVIEKKAALDQLHADYNFLIGRQGELAALVNAWEEMNKPEFDEVA